MAKIKDRAAARDAMVELGRLATELATSVAARDEAIARVNEEYAERIADEAKAVKRMKEDLGQWAEANEAAEADKETRLIRFDGCGEIQLRAGNPTVVLRRIDEALAIARCFDAGLGRFVRTVQELNRELILAERNDEHTPEKLAAIGLGIRQTDSVLFSIEGVGRV